MSRTFSLVCKDVGVKIWVGQSGGSKEGMLNFYSADRGIMQRLGRFLESTRGRPLILLCDDTQANEMEDCVEFDPDEEQEDLL